MSVFVIAVGVIALTVIGTLLVLAILQAVAPDWRKDWE